MVKGLPKIIVNWLNKAIDGGRFYIVGASFFIWAKTVMEYWSEQFEKAYEILSDNLYLPPGKNYNTSPGGPLETIEDKRIRLIDLKYDIDIKKKYGKIQFHYKEFTFKIYRNLGIDTRNLGVAI